MLRLSAKTSNTKEFFGEAISHNYLSNGVDTVIAVVTNVHGCREVLMKVDTVRDLNILILPSKLGGCSPDTIHFHVADHTNTFGPAYPYGNVTYAWNFGESGPANTSSLDTPYHIFNTYGPIYVSCTITTSNGCTVSHDTTVYGGDSSSITLTASSTHICHGQPVTFIPTVTYGMPGILIWYLGDTIIKAPFDTLVYTFPTAGVFEVHAAGSNFGCGGSGYVLADSVAVDSPVAHIGLSYICAAPGQVSFTDLSLGDDSHVWVIGGSATTATNPTHTYALADTDHVILATYDSVSHCRDTARATVYFYHPAIATDFFATTPTSICRGQSVHFKDTLTNPHITHYYWYIDSSAMLAGDSTELTYVFDSSGLHTVQLAIIDDHNCTDTLITKVHYIKVGGGTVSFTANKGHLCNGDTMTFTDSSHITGGIHYHLWTYGEGNYTPDTVMGPTTWQVYTEPGSYSAFTAQEVIVDSIGCLDTAKYTFQLYHPVAAYTINSLIPCIGVVDSVKNTSAPVGGIAAHYSWSFGGAAVDTVSPGWHVFTDTGKYVVTLTLTDTGCVSKMTDTVVVTQPHAGFTMDSTIGVCHPLPVNFTNTSTGGVSYAWMLDDGNGTTTLSDTSARHTVYDTGLHYPTLVVTDAHGCKDTAKGLTAVLGYQNEFSMTVTGSSCAQTVHLALDSLIVHAFDSLIVPPHITWSFGDGAYDSTSGDSTHHTYSVPNTYTPTVLLTAGVGCSSVGMDSSVTVTAFVATITSSTAVLCPGSSIVLSADTGAGLSYQWHRVGTAGTLSTHRLDTVALAGTYYVIESNGTCTDTSNMITVTKDSTVVDAGNDATICAAGTTIKLHATQPGFTTYSWSPAGTLDSAGIYDPTASPTTTTTYTVTATAADGCVTKDSVKVTVGNDTGACSPCKVFRGQPYVPLPGGTVDTLAAGTNYYVTGDLLLTGSAARTYDSDIIYVIPGKTITLNNKKVTMRHCHLMSCGGMWYGLRLKDHGTSQLYLQNNTLIEDADTAVYVPYNTTSPTGYYPDSANNTVFIFSSDGAIFNRNKFGVMIYKSTPGGTYLYKRYAYRVRNTVFTSRNFVNYNTGAATIADYPFEWPDAGTATGGLRLYWNPSNVFKPPYNIDNPLASLCDSPYRYAYCKDGDSSYAGILLSSTTTTDSAAGPAYGEIVIGDSAKANYIQYQNLFDNMRVGILAALSSVGVCNSSFTHGRHWGITNSVGFLTNSAGIEVVGNYQSIYPKFRLRTLGDATTGNTFYNLAYGISINKYYEAGITYNTMYSNHDTTNYSGTTIEGQYGVYFKSTVYKNADISRNRILNIKNAIILNTSADSGYAQKTGPVTINSNEVDGGDLIYPTYVDYGIKLTYTAPASGSPSVTGNIQVNSNSLNDVYNGISVNNYTHQAVTVEQNGIEPKPRCIGASPQQYGIGITGCTAAGDSVLGNDITGPGYNMPVPALTATGSAAHFIQAIYGSANNGLVVQCNRAYKINVGFRFYGTVTNVSTWKYNRLDSCRYGFVLDKTIIGQQGDSTHAIDNYWRDTTFWTSSNYQVYVIDSSTSPGGDTLTRLSPLYVRNIMHVSYPTNNSDFPGTIYNIYNSTYGLHIATDPNPYPSCTNQLGGYAKMTGDGDADDIENAEHRQQTIRLYEQITRNEINYSSHVAGSEWMGQMGVWRALQQDSTLADSSVILQQFKAMATGSRYALMSAIETAIGNQDFETALTFINSSATSAADTAIDSVLGVIITDEPGAQNVVNNYLDYYRLYIKYAAGNLTGSDTEQVNTLAHLCPVTDGVIIYNARAMYSQVYSDYRDIEDECSFGTDRTAMRRISNNSGTPAPGDLKELQQYRLQPNPTSGNITITQLTANDKSVLIKIWNAAGQTIYTDERVFSHGQHTVNLSDAISGLYLLELTDSDGKRFVCKFVVSR